jgi:hypothetical protein
MAIHYTPASPSGLTPEEEAALDPHLEVPPEMKDREEQDRITGLLFDAAAKGDRAEFHRLWKQHVVPLARKKVSSIPEPSSSPK